MPFYKIIIIIMLCYFCFSFVSVIHLFVGVVYCLISWSVGLPKRAVSSFISLYSSLYSFEFI
jgi:succinate dehydrogenase/fumarate reductase cytochrome b subunit